MSVCIMADGTTASIKPMSRYVRFLCWLNRHGVRVRVGPKIDKKTRNLINKLCQISYLSYDQKLMKDLDRKISLVDEETIREYASRSLT